MTEKSTLSDRNINNLVSRLKTFYNGNSESTRSAIDILMDENPNITSAEIFHKLSATKGKGKPHNSNGREGELKKKNLVIKRKQRKRF